MDSVELGNLDRLVYEMLQTAINRDKALSHHLFRTTTLRSSWKAFLAKFFSTGRTAKLRSEISSFIHRNNETFAEAWERFKGYTSQCPHHGFNNESLLSTVYRECLARYREMLDTASNWNFLNRARCILALFWRSIHVDALLCIFIM
ncbi:unnamed protein product [Microthlaspi erraticum]|uniref:Retrotransposon gag domain-containing protein n=1 Tax=Microthlaspi erraticum TaxID=1685480 RepID=A0A6D2ISR7_9BRAS|nr:unnamed protein product [Microthlaspi erraticum]